VRGCVRSGFEPCRGATAVLVSGANEGLAGRAKRVRLRERNGSGSNPRQRISAGHIPASDRASVSLAPCETECARRFEPYERQRPSGARATVSVRFESSSARFVELSAEQHSCRSHRSGTCARSPDERRCHWTVTHDVSGETSRRERKRPRRKRGWRG
jgi:hypothetical protein